SRLPSYSSPQASTPAAPSTACPSSPTRSKTPGARTRTSSATAAATGRTSAAAGSSICCSANRRVGRVFEAHLLPGAWWASKPRPTLPRRMVGLEDSAHPTKSLPPLVDARARLVVPAADVHADVDRVVVLPLRHDL